MDTPFKRIELESGVLIEVEDKTKHLSGDLYMVHMAVTFSVELGDKDLELLAYCPSGRLAITRVLNRPGVHKDDLERVKTELVESFIATNKAYMVHPRFVERFKKTSLERFKEQEEKARRMAGHEE
ncbi:MAG TPA: hypothetical protein PLQ43_03145 [Deltaproteobacteria bacterium]|nr:hypothetical protein [Deltaproteobacteria bacterium]